MAEDDLTALNNNGRTMQADQLIKWFYCITVSNAMLQKRYNGTVIPYAKDKTFFSGEMPLETQRHLPPHLLRKRHIVQNIQRASSCLSEEAYYFFCLYLFPMGFFRALHGKLG